MSGQHAQSLPVDAPLEDRLLAAFAMLCRHHERDVSVSDLASLVELPPDGADLATLSHLADHMGFRLVTVDASRGRLRRQPVPFIVVGGDHQKIWVVRGRTGGQLMVVEPVRRATFASTPRALQEKVDRIVTIRPLEQRRHPKRRDERRHGGPAPVLTRNLWSDVVMRRLKPVLWEIVLASVFINLLALATPIFMMTVYNKVVAQGALHTLDVLAIGMVTLFGFELLLRALRGTITSHTGAKLDLGISRHVVHHMLRLPYGTFQNMPSGQMVERLRQLDQLRQFLSGNLPLLLVDLAFVGLFLLAIFLLSPLLGIVTTAAIPLFVLLSAAAHTPQSRLMRSHFQASAGKSTALGEAVSQALTVKALGLENEMIRRFEERQLESAWSGFKAGRLANVIAALGQALQHLASLVIVYLGARMIVAGELSIGALIACTILSARALAPMRQLFFAWHQLQQTREAMRRLAAILGERPEAEGGKAAAPSIKGALTLEQVSFGYGERAAPALRRLDLVVEPGTMLGIVGPPGSGKSTLAKLVLGLERPSEGRILIDGFEIATLDPASYRPQIGFVPQEVELFAGTIIENIGLGATERSFARIVAAAKFVGVHDFIQHLPDGYDTRLGERGSGLSLGQRQLVCIARALVRNPRLLILDEATSALDLPTEAALLRNLKRAGRGRTILMITHRISVLEMCDRAILLHGGRLRAAGRPAEIVRLAQEPPEPQERQEQAHDEQRSAAR